MKYMLKGQPMSLNISQQSRDKSAWQHLHPPTTSTPATTDDVLPPRPAPDHLSRHPLGTALSTLLLWTP